MSETTAEVLSALQFADSFFPTGATSTSNGLEALVDDGVVDDPDSLERFIGGQLRWRWAPFERPFLVAAHRYHQNLQTVVLLDRRIHAHTLGMEARQGSIRTGKALLRMHAGIDTPGAVEYQDRVVAKSAFGHNVIVQGFVWGASNITTTKAELISAHTFCVTYLGAAIRLGIVGHQRAQRILVSLQKEIAQLIKTPRTEVDHVTSFCPEQEVAAMRHEKLSSRLFSN